MGDYDSRISILGPMLYWDSLDFGNCRITLALSGLCLSPGSMS